MRGRTWNSWTQFDTVDEPAQKKDGGPGSKPSPESKQSKSAETSPTAFQRSLHRSAADALERAMDLSEVRMERVARIRTAMAANGYDVPASDLAQKLMQTMLGEFH